MSQPVRTTLRGVTSMATRSILSEIGAAFAAQSGIGVAFEAMGGVDAARAVREGRAVDLVALANGPVDALIREGHAMAGTRTDYAVSSIAVAVRHGAPRPSIATAEAVRRASAAARRVAFSTGPSGDHIGRLLAGWGQDGAGHALVAPPGVPVATLVARGEADLGFQQFSEMTGVDGIDVLGTMPAPIGLDTVFACAAGAKTTEAAAARAFLAFLAGPAAADAIRRGGMVPAGR